MWRAGTGVGPSWDAGLNYRTVIGGSNSAGSALLDGFTDTAGWVTRNVSNSSDGGVTGFMRLYNPRGSSAYKMEVSQVTHMVGSNLANRPGSVRYEQTTALTGVRFFFPNGNIASGTIRACPIVQ
jgi:hypothetical protein